MNTFKKFKINPCFYLIILILFPISVFSQDDLFGILREDTLEIKKELLPKK